MFQELINILLLLCGGAGATWAWDRKGSPSHGDGKGALRSTVREEQGQAALGWVVGGKAKDKGNLQPSLRD